MRRTPPQILDSLSSQLDTLAQLLAIAVDYGNLAAAKQAKEELDEICYSLDNELSTM